MKVVLLLIDGLGFHYLTPALTPFWSAHSTPCRNVLPSITVPNWATILSGRLPKQHGITKNEQVSYLRGKRVLSSGQKPLSTLCDDRPSVLISDWNPMRAFTSDVFVHERHPFRVFRRIWRQHVHTHDGFIINTDCLDALAHARGWNSPAYQKVMQRIDQQTRDLFHFLCQQGEPFVLMGVADHGGFRHNHESVTNPRVRTVPFLWVNGSRTPIPRPRIRSTRHIRSVWLALEA